MSKLAAFALLFATACGGHAFTTSDDRAIRGLLGAQQQAWNRGDLEAYMAGYLRSQELVFTSGGLVRQGWDETLAKYRARYGESQATMGTLVFDILSIQALGSDGAVVLGKWTLTDTPESGSGIFSVVLRRTGDGWRVVHDHTSSDPKPIVP
jgi:ketosteroid isomerase-like protein